MTFADEKRIDEQYGIDTCGRDDSREDTEHRAYEPTPYDVLELIAESGIITPDDVVVDMGAGKGRVSIFFAKELGCKVRGIEYDDKIFDLANENLDNVNKLSGKKLPVEFINESAEKYAIKKEDTVFFFFNPFSEKILETVLANIEKSYYDCKRKIKLLFYYPSLEYVGRLMTKDYFEREVVK